MMEKNHFLKQLMIFLGMIKNVIKIHMIIKVIALLTKKEYMKMIKMMLMMMIIVMKKMIGMEMEMMVLEIMILKLTFKRRMYKFR